MNAIRRLSEVGLTDVALVGAKAANLGDLLRAGVRVPDGIVLTADAASLPDDERARMLQSSLGELDSGPYAVRSSGIAEDGSDQSFAGMYETVLDVPADGVVAAAERVLASVGSPRLAHYRPHANGRMAVIVQHMVRPAAAGVALTADPVTGDRDATIITAVTGLGERLVSGQAAGDEWVVRGAVARARRRPERALEPDQVLRVAVEARRIAEMRGAPQDVEWAMDADGVIWIVQTRPMTAVPPEVSWDAPAAGGYARTVRLGEWIAGPVTPLFESWLLSTMEERIHSRLGEWIGQYFPRPSHVVVNGWYFYSVNFLSARALARTLPRLLWRLIRMPRRVSGLLPPMLRHSVPVFEREWREELLPRYRAAVASAEARVETAPVGELPSLVDELSEVAGDYFASVTALAGSAYKAEISLARFHRRHLSSVVGASHLPLVVGLEPPGDPGRHAVVSLDWSHPPLPSKRLTQPAGHDRLVTEREAAEARALDVLASSPKRREAFLRHLRLAQHLVRVREEQVRDLTLAWPVMRKAVLRIGGALAERSILAEGDDAFYLTREEMLDALAAVASGGTPTPIDVQPRRADLREHARLVPPLLIGHFNPMLRKMWDTLPRLMGAVPSEKALVSGSPASPGRASGSVRVVRGAHEFDQLQPGEILVAPLTAPAWTPLFTRAAAVVTDVGSAASHASIIAREYGIPAVVGCGDATARLRNGLRVTVDGTTGNVEPG